MNLETKITIYKFTPQLFTLTHVRYIVYFYKIESGWNIEKVEECL